MGTEAGRDAALGDTEISGALDTARRARLTADALERDLSPAHAERYRAIGSLGHGGMGEIDLCEDARVGREVALKRLRAEWANDSTARPRFIREARIQGQLEHPAVVPVYDLELGTDDIPFFTMKRVQGLTLQDVLGGLRTGDAAMRARFSQRKLLTAFSTVCLAADFAHSRGVVHRDLKPANVMLGDFGEIHLLDWGIARIDGGRDSTPHPGQLEASGSNVPIDAGGLTEPGMTVGTLGYMAPEQLAGDLARVTAQSDVYALGCILFELLTFEPLHNGKTRGERVGSTLKGATTDGRMPNVPRELVEIVTRAIAVEPADRFASARALSEAIERFLDGATDPARRENAAREQLSRARTLTASPDATTRSEAVRELFRGLALAPDSVEGAALFAEALNRPLETFPPESRDHRTAALATAGRRARELRGLQGLLGASVLLAALVAWPLEWKLAGALGLCALLTVFLGELARRTARRLETAESRLFGQAWLLGRLAAPATNSPEAPR